MENTNTLKIPEVIKKIETTDEMLAVVYELLVRIEKHKKNGDIVTADTMLDRLTQSGKIYLEKFKQECTPRSI